MHQRRRLSASIATGFLAAWILLFPITANALGFGNISIKSALNQPLVAEIELLSATADEVKELEVKLASREAFMRAGVDRSALLSRIKFDIVKRQGKYFVTLRTQETIREPFLNFLLEMNWKSGRMLREYTVLLDPPEQFQRQQVAQVPETTPPQVTPAPAPIPEPEPIPEPTPVVEPEPVLAEPTPEPELVPAPEPEPIAAPEPVPAPEEVAAAPEPAPAPEVVTEPEVATPPAEALAQPEETEAFEEDAGGLFPQIPLNAYNEAALEAADEIEAPLPEASDVAEQPETYEPVGELDYGITRKGDSAWKVAAKLKPNDQVSIYQVMMALQQSNPSAFVDGNIHRLKEGQVLRIDDPTLLTAMSKAQAAEQYQLQTSAWEEYLASTGNLPRQAIVAGEQPEAPAETGVPSGELTLSTPQAEELTEGSSGVGEVGSSSPQEANALRAQVEQAMADASSERAKNAELTSRLTELENELQRLENLVNVKDSDLAALQAKLDEFNAQRAAAGETPAAPVEATPPPEAVEPTPAPVEPTPEPAAPVEAVEPEPVVSEPVEPIASEPVEPAPVEPVVSEPVEPVVEPTPIEPAPAPVEVQPREDQSGGIMATITGLLAGISIFGGLNPLMVLIGLVVLVIVVILLVFVIIRRRRGIHFQESILQGGDEAANVDVPSATANVEATPSQQGASVIGGESSFLSDFAISGVSAIQAEDSEVDPLTEADVFMAYGRYEAAEERLQEAIGQDPNRGELRVKLLELYNTTKNKQGFETAAENFYATLGGNAAADPLWQKVVAMGSEIAPSNPLFSGDDVVVDASLGHVATTNFDEEQVMDIGLDTGVFSKQDLAGESPEAPSADADLDFNLGGIEEETPASPEPTAAADDGLDFSLDSSEESLEMPQPVADDGLDFNLDMGDSSDESTQTAIPTGEGGLDFNLDTDSPTADDIPAPVENSSDESMEFSLDLDSGDDPTATDIKLGLDEQPEPSGELDFDLNTGDDEEPSHADIAVNGDAGMDMNLDAGDALDLEMPDGTDEVGTKLDLARAYIDMGDPDGARSILDEVIEEGDATQKQEAEQLMTQIG